jgi:membrane-bound ClpP family serine protease
VGKHDDDNGGVRPDRLTTMEQLLQHIDPGTAALVLVGLCVLCLVLPMLMTGLHFVAAIVDGIGHVVTLALHVISGGPLQWCGCLLAIGGCGLLAGTVWLIGSGLANCASYQTNFCALFGW